MILEMIQNFILVDGQWSNWSAYTVCSLTCGGGEQHRNRTCSNPEPQFGGKTCPGAATGQRHCNTKPCPSMCTLNFYQNMCDSCSFLNHLNLRVYI